MAGAARYGVLKIAAAAVCCLLFAAPSSVSQDVSLDISVDRTVLAVGETLNLQAVFYGAKDVPPPQLGEVQGFTVNYIGQASKMSVINGRMSVSVTHNYRLLAMQEGTHTIGPVSAGYKGQVYTSNAVTVRVVKGVSRPAAPPVSQGVSAPASQDRDINKRVFLRMIVGKTSAYVNEPIPVLLKLCVNNVPIGRAQYPDFDHEGFTVDALQELEQKPEVINGMMYQVKEFKTYISATRPGEFTVGPAEMKAEIQAQRRRGLGSLFDDDAFGGIFSRFEYYPITLNADPVKIRINDLPEEGKPAGFKGAVGNYKMDVTVSPQTVKAGDPVTMTVKVTGSGNLSTVTAPEIAESGDLKVYEPRAVSQDDYYKTFEIVAIPRSVAVKELPAVNFSFFDTSEPGYRTLTQGPFPVEVLKPEKEERAQIVGASAHSGREAVNEVLGRDIMFIKNNIGPLPDSRGPLYENRIFLWMQPVPFVLFMLYLINLGRRRRLKTDSRYARSIRASRKVRQGLKRVRKQLVSGKAGAFYDELFKTMREYIADKLHLPTGGLTADVVMSELQKRNVGGDVINVIVKLYEECDAFRYAHSQVEKAGMESSFARWRDAVEYLERARL